MEKTIMPGNLDSLDDIRRYVEDAAAQAGLEKKPTYSLTLAVDEIAANIVMYGYSEESGCKGDITIWGELTDETLTIVLEDSAREYDPRAHTMPSEEDLSKPLEDRCIGGLGIFLTLNGVDRFDYQRVENRNRNIFIMNRPKAK